MSIAAITFMALALLARGLSPAQTGVVLGLLPIALDGFTQLFGWRESTNELRVITGGPGGFVGGLLVGAMLIAIRQIGLDIQAMRARLAASPARSR